jgi:hypothetical protein
VEEIVNITTIAVVDAQDVAFTPAARAAQGIRFQIGKTPDLAFRDVLAGSSVPDGLGYLRPPFRRF